MVGRTQVWALCLVLVVLPLTSCRTEAENPVAESKETPATETPTISPTPVTDGHETSPEALRLVGASGDLLNDEGTTSMSMAMEIEVSTGPTHIEGEGSYDFRRETGSLDMTLEIPYVPKPLKTTVLSNFPLMYTNLGSTLSAMEMDLPKFKPWWRMSWKSLDELLAMEEALGLMRFTHTDASLYSLFPRGVVEVTEVGSEEVRGEPTTRYRTELDFGLLTTLVPMEMRPDVDSLWRMLNESRIPMDVWLDERDRLVRERFETTLLDPNSGPERSMSADLTFFNFGKRVEVHLPPDNQVMGFEEVLELSQ